MLHKLNHVHLLLLACAFYVLSAALSVDADIIYVPGDYPTIQEGINAAVHGDEVVVADGTWTGALNKNLDYGGRLIIVRSENGPENCIIDCQGTGRGFYFHNGEDSSSVVEGLTIKNGSTDFGGGIYNNNTSPTVTDCIFLNNSATYSGGIYNWNSSPVVTNCNFADNWSGQRGGGNVQQLRQQPDSNKLHIY